MSIRLRLTLLYSAILTLTLLVFGVALYSIQAQDTHNALQRDLVLSSEKLVEAALRASMPRPSALPQREPPPPKSFDEFSSEQVFQDLREREIVRILDADGNLVASPFGRTEDALPLSEEGLAALQNRQEWWADETIAGEHPIVPVMVRDTERTSALVQRLFEKGILVTGLDFPVVPKGDEEIRLQVSATHTEQDIDFVIDALRD